LELGLISLDTRKLNCCYKRIYTLRALNVSLSKGNIRRGSYNE
jgi:hypothetical protein